MKIAYSNYLFIVVGVAATLTGCASQETRKDRIDSEIQQEWSPAMIGNLTREQAFRDCDAKSKDFDVRSQDPLNNWNTFMRTCMKEKGFTKTEDNP